MIRNDRLSFRISFILSALLTAIFCFNAVANQPNSQVTPGALCTTQDRDFKGLAYPSQVAICQRNISYGEKVLISQEYNLPQSSWPNVEFDHLIPLCAGGSNNIRNLWPEALPHAQKKDKIENAVCIGLRNGTMTQAQAVSTVFQWLRANP